MSTPRPRMSFDVFGTALILLAVLLTACLKQTQSDTFWALRAGKEIFENRTVSEVETWSYTAVGRAWPNHEWLWQLGAYALYAVGGWPLLSALNAVAAVAAVALSRSLAPLRGRLGLVLLALAMLPVSETWTLRPQVLSLMLFMLTIRWVAHERYLRLPLLFLIWANLHAGVSTGGLLLVGATSLALVQHLRSGTATTRERLVKLAWITPLCGVLTLVNPMGFGLWAYVLGAPGDPAHRYISEWHSAFLAQPLVGMFWAWLVGTIAVVVVRRRRFGAWSTQVVLLSACLTAPLAVLAVRNLGAFLLCALPTALIALAPERVRANDTVPAARALLVVAAAACAALVGLVWALAPNYLGWNVIPPAAARAVQRCPAPVYSHYNDGGFLLWFAPRVKVYDDSRQDPYPFRVLQQDFVLGRTGDYHTLFAEYGIRCAFLRTSSLTKKALLHDGWQRVYADPLWVVLTKPQ